MNVRLLPQICITVLLGLGLAGVAQAVDPGLVGWWKLDETSGRIAHDASGLGNDGTLQGDIKWVTGKMGGAWQGDGNGDYIRVPHNESLNLGDRITVALWAFGGLPPDQLLCKGNDNSGWQSTYSFRIDDNAAYRRKINFRGRVNAYSLNSNTALPEAEWTHIAITFDVGTPGNNQKIYLNGKLDAEKRTTTPLSKNTADLLLGADGNGSTRWHWQGMLDDIHIYNRALTADEIQLVMNLGTLGSPQKATNPHPADGQTDVARDAILTWTPGDSVQASQGHRLFLSKTVADVNDGSPAASLGIYDANTYAEAGKLPLEFGQTHYWRVDEIKNGDPNSPWKGSVWSFTTEPYAYSIPGAKITATASSQAAGAGPEKTIDGSGLAGGLHGTDPTTMWLSAGVLPNWIQYQFDKVYKLYELKVWNSNQLVEAALGYSAKKVTIETSPDGTAWTPVANVPEFTKATGAAGYAANTTVPLGGVLAKYVKLTINSTWSGVQVTGLSEVQFSYVPVQARAPQPATAATGVRVDTALEWRPGREAASHSVFFGTDATAVANGTIAAKMGASHSYTPGALDFGTAYFWRVDEVNAVTYPGDVWSFTTQEYAVVDNFESYTDKAGGEVFSAWIDGYADKSSGSTVGYINSANGTFGETTIIHGGRQSMPFEYNNVKPPYYSEAVRTFDTPQDWTSNGADTLSLWFRGYPTAFADKGNNAYTVSGGGTDIGGTSDQFRFVYKQLSGDGSITVRVDSQTNTNTAARAGVMIRGTIEAGSMHATLAVTPGSSITLLSRAGAGGATTTTAVTGGLKAPYWVRITRTGNSFKAEYSPDGKTWTQAGINLTLLLGNNAYIGLAVSSHAATQISVADFSNVSTTGTVTGQWQVLAIGATQPSNDPAAVYLVVEDKAGKKKTVVNPNPSATTLMAWTEWRIPLGDLSSAGVNLAAVKKLTLGVGDRTNPKAGAAGMLYFDDIAYGHPIK